MKIRRTVLILACLSVAALSVVFALRRKPSLVLPDGSILRMEGVTYGTNAFVHGTTLEKLLRRWIPVEGEGLDVLGRKLRCPPRYPLLRQRHRDVPTVWFGVTESRRGGDQRNWGDDLRVVAFGPDGREFENPAPDLHPLSQFAREPLLTLPLTAFPRNGRKVGVRIWQRNPPNAWTNAMEFFIANHYRAKPVEWQEQALPTTNHFDRLEVILEKLAVGTGLVHYASSRLNSGLRIRVIMNGRAARGWTLADCLMRDKEDNFQTATLHRSGRDSEMVLASPFSLDPRELWKIELELFPDIESPASESHAFRIPGDSQPHFFTNGLGTVISARLHQNLLDMWLTGPLKPKKRFTLLSAKDEKGESKGLGRSISLLGWERDGTRWEFDGEIKALDVAVALHHAVSFEYHARPMPAETLSD